MRSTEPLDGHWVGSFLPNVVIIHLIARSEHPTRHQFTQVAAEHPRACLNDMSWNPATSDQVNPSGSRHLIIGDSLVRDLNEIFVYGQATTQSFGGASVEIFVYGQATTQSFGGVMWRC